MKRARRSAAFQRLVEEIYIPGRSQARGRKMNLIKDDDPHRNGDSSSTSQTRLIVNKKLAIVLISNVPYTVNCERPTSQYYC